MKSSLWASIALIALGGLACSSNTPVPEVSTPADGRAPTTATNADDYQRLLKSYAAYKKYGNLSIADIEMRLTGDRLNTVQALVRAAHTDLRSGNRLVAWMSELRGIWGVRAGNREGRHQFRLSVVWKPGFRKAIGDSSAFEGALGAHVLMPVQTGGDDDPAFAGFTVDNNARTWRQLSDAAPRAQVSQLKSDESVGEIDMDYDSWVCHTRPSNSDSGTRAGHTHIDMLNIQFPFGSPLTFSCRNSRSHCDKSYAAPYCDQS
jgi:hypothetical protein